MDFLINKRGILLVIKAEPHLNKLLILVAVLQRTGANLTTCKVVHIVQPTSLSENLIRKRSLLSVKLFTKILAKTSSSASFRILTTYTINNFLKRKGH